MAATRLMALHIVRGRSIAESLKERMDYTENDLKTENRKYISTYGCDIETADEEFLLSSQQYHNNVRDIRAKEIIAYQIRQSFKPGEITPDKANEIGYEHAMRFTKGKYAFTVCTHTDKAHIHNHIIFNAISIDGTKKFRDFYFSGIALRRISDILCVENGLSVIKPAPYAERKSHGRYSRKGHFADKRLEFLKDIEAKLQEGKGKGYVTWAKRFNAKQMAKTILFLQEHGIEMRLTSMADAFINQKDDPRMKDLSFEDHFGMLVDVEYNNRKSNSLKRLIKGAGFDQPDAYIGDIDYLSGRKLNRELIQRLGTCEYITDHRNIFITGATGSGKTYMACALGMEACKQRYKTKYVRLPDLLMELEMARDNGSYVKVQKKYANPILLIIDEWLLLKPTENEQHDILELLHHRRKKSSTSFCSQYEFNGWFDQLGGDDSPLAEAILDRIKYDAYKINIVPVDPANNRSMREVYGMDPRLSE